MLELPSASDPGFAAAVAAAAGDVGDGTGCFPINENVTDASQITDCHTISQPCQKTRISAILYAFFFNFPFLGLVYFGCIWLAIIVFLITLLVFACRRRQSAVQRAIYDVQDDLNDSDDDGGAFAPSWSRS